MRLSSLIYCSILALPFLTTADEPPLHGPVATSPTDLKSGLIGYLYDLKQTRDTPPKPTGITRQDWKKIAQSFVDAHFDEKVLSPYLKSTEGRACNGFCIDEQSSQNGPIGFGMKDVGPNLWLAVYHGKAVAPRAGRYRFVGFGDDILYINLNGKPIFDGGWQALTMGYPDLHETYPYVWSNFLGTAALLRKGAWFSLEKEDIINLDILIGDWGGKCGYILLLETDGVSYDLAPDFKTPRLPIFQMGDLVPLPKTPSSEPPIQPSSEIWEYAPANN